MKHYKAILIYHGDDRYCESATYHVRDMDSGEVVARGLNREMAQAMAWRLNRDSIKLYDKVRGY